MSLKESSSKRGRSGKSSERHDLAVALRAVLPIMIGGLVAFLVLIPLSTVAVPETSIFNVAYTHAQLKYRFFETDLTGVVIGATVLLGIVLALASFRFLLTKRATTAFLSLSRSRTRLLVSRVTASLVAMIVVIFVPLVVSLCLNVAALGAMDGIYLQWLYVCVGLLLVAIVAFALTTIACMFAGTMTEAVIFSAVLLSAVTVVCFGANALMLRLLVGNAFGASYLGTSTTISASLIDRFAWLNPVLFFLDPIAAHQSFTILHPVYEPPSCDWTFLGGWALFAIVLLVLCGVLMVRRPGERAGMPGSAPGMSLATAVVIGVMVLGAVFSLISSTDVTVAVICSCAAFLLVITALLLGPLHGRAHMRRTLVLIGAATVVVAGLIGMIGAGGFGYSTRMPKVEDVTSVQVSYTGSPNYVSAGFDTASSSKGSYYFNTTRTYTAASDIEKVKDVSKALIATGRANLKSDSQDWEKSVVPFDTVVRYTLADGSEEVRYYNRASFAEIASLTMLDSGDTDAALRAAVVDGDTTVLSADYADDVLLSSAYRAYRSGTIYLSDCRYADSVVVTCSVSARAALLEALAKDVAAQTPEDRYHPSGNCRGVIMFTQSASTDADTFSYALENTVIYLTDSFTNTLDWLEANGLTSYTDDPGIDAAESMTVQRYDPYLGKNAVTTPSSLLFMGYRASDSSAYIVTQDYGAPYVTDDQSKMAELLPLLRNDYLMDDGGYLVCMKLSGIDRYAYYFLPEASAPDWLVRMVG